MNKADLVDYIAQHADITKTDANRTVDAFVGAVTQSLAKGEEVTLIGFGTFSVTERQAREGRNPKTGEPLQIAASKVGKFKPGKNLREAIHPVQKEEVVKKAAPKKAAKK